MKRNWIRPIALFLIVLIVLTAGTALYLSRPLVIQDGSRTYSLRMSLNAPLFKVSEALYASGLILDPADRVSPALDAWIPPDGKIRVERAAHLAVWLEGSLMSVDSFAPTLQQALAGAGIFLKSGDALERNGQPVDPTAPLLPGGAYFVAIQRGASLTVTDRGETKTIATRSEMVARGLWEAGIRLSPGDRVSAQPGSSLPAGGLSIEIVRAREVTITAGGHEVSASTSAQTVSQALADAAVSLQGLDYSVPAGDQPLPPDGKIQVVRVREALVLEQEITPFKSESRPDPNVELDQRRVVQAGQNGVKVNRYRVLYQNGEETSRTLDAQWTASDPQPQVIGLGTKAVEHSLDTPDGTITYWRAVTVYATSYSPCHINGPDDCSYGTASGAHLTKGIIAVTPAWYRLMKGQRVYIPGYGFGVIADTGYGIPGRRWIDLGYDDSNYVDGARTVTLYFLSPIPASVPYTLP